MKIFAYLLAFVIWYVIWCAWRFTRELFFDGKKITVYPKESRQEHVKAIMAAVERACSRIKAGQLYLSALLKKTNEKKG